jgi:hypothetical protein
MLTSLLKPPSFQVVLRRSFRYAIQQSPSDMTGQDSQLVVPYDEDEELGNIKDENADQVTAEDLADIRD